MIRALLRTWDRIFFVRFDPYAVCVMRICVGVFWLCMIACLYPNWDRFFGADGISGAVDAYFSKLQDPYSVFYWSDGRFSPHVWWWVSMCAGALFTAGWWSRPAAFILWAMQASMLHRTPLICSGEDVVLVMVFFWSIFMPIDRELSVDSWLRRKAFAQRRLIDDRPAPMIWATRAFQIHLLVIYAFSLPRKLATDPAWLNGDAVFFAVIDTPWTSFPWPQLFYHRWVTCFFTWSTVLFEGVFPYLVWFRRLRLPLIFVMTLFHIGIALMLKNVTFFSIATVLCYWALIPGETARRWFGALRRIAHTRRVDRGVAVPEAIAG